jgi:cell division protein FtsI (penicillin-binding protein 3)
VSTRGFKRADATPFPLPRFRALAVFGALGLVFAGLLGRALYLQSVDNGFLQEKGAARFAREIDLPAHRGRVVDRFGDVLAISTPVKSLWTFPDQFEASPAELAALARVLETTPQKLAVRVSARDDYALLARQIPPEQAARAMALRIKGLNEQDEYRRYYPGGEISAQIVGFTGDKDAGQEGIELAQQAWLAGQTGSRRVIINRRGDAVEDIAAIRAPQAGRDLALAIDSRLQYVAFRELKAAVERHNAKAGGVVVIDTKTGEILALANLPTYNPNARNKVARERMRNRALTDVFEPGSTMKPFIIGTALEKGLVTPTSMVDATPGSLVISGFAPKDAEPNGWLTVQQVIQKSSNIGAARLAMKLTPKEEWEKFSSIGLGQKPQINFPGVVTGRLRPYKTWRPIEQATMAYGYGLSASLFQLARAYTVFANDGVLENVSMLRQKAPGPGPRVFKSETVKELLTMLQMVASPGGTAPKARTLGYSVGGKSGTAYKAEGHGYAQNKYRPWFVGLAPISHPRIVVAVMVDEPTAGLHYGGDVAAPVFSQVVSQTLPLLGVAPDLDVRTQITQANVVQIPEN